MADDEEKKIDYVAMVAEVVPTAQAQAKVGPPQLRSHAGRVRPPRKGSDNAALPVAPNGHIEGQVPASRQLFVLFMQCAP